jgi:hypothetical protein
LAEEDRLEDEFDDELPIPPDVPEPSPAHSASGTSRAVGGQFRQVVDGPLVTNCSVASCSHCPDPEYVATWTPLFVMTSVSVPSAASVIVPSKPHG